MEQGRKNERPGIMQRFISFFGLNGSIGAMIFLVIFVGMGERMAERFLPLYILSLGGTALAVGLLNTLTNLLGALYSFPGGYLSDKIGHKKALILFTCVAIFGYLLVVLIPVWQAVLVGALFFIAWSAITLPAVMSLVADVMKKEKRTMGVTIHSFVRRIPMALGPLVGGILIAAYGRVLGIRVAFIGAIALGLVAIVLVLLFMEEAPGNGKGASMKGMLANLNGPLRNLLVSDILIRFAEQIPYAFVVVWVVERLHFTEFQFGMLTTIEMVTAMVIYIPVAYYADKYAKKPFVLMTFVFFTIFPVVLYFSRSFVMLVAAFIIRGLKEFGEPTRKALIMDLAPEGAKAGTFGVYYLVRDVIVSGAALSSAFLWEISPEVNFMTAAVFGVIGTLLFAKYGKDLSGGEKSA